MRLMCAVLCGCLLAAVAAVQAGQEKGNREHVAYQRCTSVQAPAYVLTRGGGRRFSGGYCCCCWAALVVPPVEALVARLPVWTVTDPLPPPDSPASWTRSKLTRLLR